MRVSDALGRARASGICIPKRRALDAGCFANNLFTAHVAVHSEINYMNRDMVPLILCARIADPLMGVCGVRRNGTSCNSTDLRYWYNDDLQKCEKFQYCSGDSMTNVFGTLQACYAECGSKRIDLFKCPYQWSMARKM